ncbi:MAG: hypothetical protein E7116_05070 [Bacteroidales bacterium]|nr:hypothetical protein [Bacteroidales bacterium]
MATFIENLTSVHEGPDCLGKTIDEKFLIMGQKCPLLPHLIDIEVPRHCFIALNVQTMGNKIIPFYSIAKNGKIDSDSLRKEVVKKAAENKDDDFLSCPKFIKEYKVEHLDLAIKYRRNKFSVVVNSIKCYSEKKSHGNFLKKVEKHLNRTSGHNFISAWADSFRDEIAVKDFHAILKVTDPGMDMVGRSFFMILAQEKFAVSYIYEKYSVSIMDIISIIKSLYMDDINLMSKKEAIKSAISAIMSRNMSHNLGSHYLYYTKAHLEELAKTQSDIAPDIRGTAKVLGYIQARMDYLATVISNDKYPYGAVNFKSQLFDELTVDKFSKRHFSEKEKINLRTTNFLLSNLVLSENFSISDIHEDRTSSNKTENNNRNLLELYVKLQGEDGLYDQFTGTNNKSLTGWPTFKTETPVKNALSNLHVALPGGIMSSHAFFNVVENFIRNSAKYLQVDFRPEGLIFNIAIREQGNAKQDANSYLDLIIYDNKSNANKVHDGNGNGYYISDMKSVRDGVPTLYEQILKKLGAIKIINDSNNEIEKDSKGFKEILFSSAWMKSYEYNSSSYADVMTSINQDVAENDKLALIEKYGFSLVQVVENKVGSGKNTRFDLSIYDRNSFHSMPDEHIAQANLGIMITLPKFNKYVKFVTQNSLKANIESMLNVYSDIVGVDQKYINDKTISHCFTRTFDGPQASSVSMMKSILNKRFGNIDSYKLVFDNCKEVFTEELSEKERLAKTLFFKRHLNSKDAISDYLDYAYADTVSGGNFTVTINDLISKGVNEDGSYKDEDSEYFALKVKESALTRITIIDERLFNSMSGKELEYSTKNLRVLNYIKDGVDSLSEISNDVFDEILHGNRFRDGKSNTHFLSIHLGLIEKMLKNSVVLNNVIDEELNGRGLETISEDRLSPERVRVFMELLEKKFGNDNGDTFISIHSGRGNFSKELEGPLAKYPFVSLSALENAFNNSKYLLSQIFYNTVYIGKGMANDIKVQ